jgi:cytochrome c oxidase subunit II
MRFLTALFTSWIAFATASFAQAGQPTDGALGFQRAVTPVMEQITEFHNLLLIVITVITLIVLALLLYVVFKFRASANPVPKKFSHNTLIEIIWTAVPVLILVVIAVPSFRLLYAQDVIPDGQREYYGEVVAAPAFTIKATGYQWYWSYEYADLGIGEYFSNMIPDDEIDLAAGQLRLLSVDYPVVVPVGATVRMQVTAADVIHNWAMPSFGIKMDAIPGRLNETWFRADEEGTYFGQCSELCGLNHAFMPIEVRVVSQEAFDAWAAAAAEDPDAANALLAEYETDRRATRLAAR